MVFRGVPAEQAVRNGPLLAKSFVFLFAICGYETKDSLLLHRLWRFPLIASKSV